MAAARSPTCAAIPTTSGRRAISAPRAPRSATCTPIPTGCANRWSAPATATPRSSWDDAYAEVERVLRPVLDRYGAPAVTVYVGNPVAHNLALSTHIGALIGMAQAAGMPAYYSPGTVDQWPLNLVSALLFGHMWNAPIPDVDRTDHLMILGANPSASQG